MSEHNYVNDSVIAANRDNHRDPASLFDVFDMRKRMFYYSYSGTDSKFTLII
jgi:hypothetical protein